MITDKKIAYWYKSIGGLWFLGGKRNEKNKNKSSLCSSKRVWKWCHYGIFGTKVWNNEDSIIDIDVLSNINTFSSYVVYDNNKVPPTDNLKK